MWHLCSHSSDIINVLDSYFVNKYALIANIRCSNMKHNKNYFFENTSICIGGKNILNIENRSALKEKSIIFFSKIRVCFKN